MTSIENLRAMYLEQFTNILRGAYKAGKTDAIEAEEIQERIHKEAETAYIAGVEDAFIAVQRLEQMSVTQIGDCLGYYENTIGYLIDHVRPITIVRKINEWVDKPHWIPSEKEVDCTFGDSKCSKCNQVGFAVWKHCPNCGSKMEGVKDG